jgi:ssRNA-specific RNase YbeY (16S rRNA maturation enzyme)
MRLIEVKTKVSRMINAKTRKITETYIINKEFFSEAEYAVSSVLAEEQNQGLIESFEILSLKDSSIKEIATQYRNDENPTFLITLKAIWLEDDGTEKYIRYKVLLWAADLTEANSKAHELAREGYDMAIEGIKQADYIYLTQDINE